MIKRKNSLTFLFRSQLYLINSLKYHTSNICYGDKDKIKVFDELMKRRFFFDASFSAYGAIAGIYDYGPTLTSIKQNFLESWREHFILSEKNIYQIETSTILSEKVLKASGHVDKFQDILIKDSVTGDCFRVDHFLFENLKKNQKISEERLNEIIIESSEWTPEIYKEKLNEFNLTKNPETGNLLGDPFYFNLMFHSKIGAEGKQSGFLRPELAQGIFLNFPRLLEQVNPILSDFFLLIF